MRFKAKDRPANSSDDATASPSSSYSKWVQTMSANAAESPSVHASPNGAATHDEDPLISSAPVAEDELEASFNGPSSSLHFVPSTPQMPKPHSAGTLPVPHSSPRPTEQSSVAPDTKEAEDIVQTPLDNNHIKWMAGPIAQGDLPNISDERTNVAHSAALANEDVAAPVTTPSAKSIPFTLSDDEFRDWIPLLLLDCSADTPSFRAHVLLLEDQLTKFELWANNVLYALDHYCSAIARLQDSALLLGKTLVPSFNMSELISSDIAVASVNLIRKSIDALGDVLENYLSFASSFGRDHFCNFLASNLQGFKNAFHEFHRAQNSFDVATAKLHSQRNRRANVTTEASSNVFSAWKEYLEMSFSLVKMRRSFVSNFLSNLVNSSRADIGTSLNSICKSLDDFERLAGEEAALDTLSADVLCVIARMNSWLDRKSTELKGTSIAEASKRYCVQLESDSSTTVGNTTGSEESGDQDRSTASDLTVTENAHSSAKSNRGKERARASLSLTEDDAAKSIAKIYRGRSLSESQTETLQPTKSGYLFMKSMSKHKTLGWRRCWFLLHEGSFGFIVINKLGFVDESQRTGVLLCNIKPAPFEERRFCFEIRTKYFALILQASSQTDLVSWLNCFECSKRAVLLSTKEHSFSAFSITTPHFREFAYLEGKIQETVAPLQTVQSSQRPNLEATRTWSGLSPAMDRRIGNNSHGREQKFSFQYSLLPSITDDETRLAILDEMTEKLDQNYFVNTSFAPMLLAPSPLATCMSPAAMVVLALYKSNLDMSSALANFWGTCSLERNYASAYRGYFNTKERLNPGDDSKPAKAIDDSKDIVVPSFTRTELPEDYPVELRRNNIQFRSIFTSRKSTEHVLQVFSGALTMHQEEYANTDGSRNFSESNRDSDAESVPSRVYTMKSPKEGIFGRFYVTIYGIYFYSNMFGNVVLREMPFSEVLLIESLPGAFCNYLALELYKSKIALIKIGDSDVDVLRNRLRFLKQNQMADTPLQLRTLYEKLSENKLHFFEDDDEIHRRIFRKNVAKLLGPDDISREARNQYASDLKYRSKGFSRKRKQSRDINDDQFQRLPLKAIEVSRSDHYHDVLKDRVLHISAKNLFHILFGDRSGIFQLIFVATGATEIRQSPWETIQGGMRKVIRYKIPHQKKSERKDDAQQSKLAEVQSISSDSQADKHSQPSSTSKAKEGDGLDDRNQLETIFIIEIRDEYLFYSVKISFRCSRLPLHRDYHVDIRITISFVSSGQCRLMISQRIVWSRRIPIVSIIIERGVRTVSKFFCDNVLASIEEQVHKLGRHPKTSLVVRLFGKVGEMSEPMRLMGAPAPESRVSLSALARRDFLNVFVGVFYQMGLSLITLIVQITKELSVNKILVSLLVLQALWNFSLLRRQNVISSVQSAADRITAEIDAASNNADSILGRAVYIRDVDEYVKNSLSVSVGNGLCYKMFQATTSQIEGSFPLQTEQGSDHVLDYAAARLHIAHMRHQHMVALKVLGKLEQDLVEGQWLEFVRNETIRCASIGGSLEGDSSKLDRLRDYCDDCAHEQIRIDEKLYRS